MLLAALGVLLYGPRVAHVTGPKARVEVVKPALIGVNRSAIPEIIKIPDGTAAGGDLQELDRAFRYAAGDQGPMKGVEERIAERVGFTPSRPRANVQLLERIKEG